MSKDYDYELIQAYEFMLPISFERFASVDTLDLRIPYEFKEGNGYFGTLEQRMKALRIAIDFVRERSKLNDHVDAYKYEIGEATNWGSSSVVLSKEMLGTISDGIKSRQELPKKKLKELMAKLEELEFEAKHKIRVIYGVRALTHPT